MRADDGFAAFAASCSPALLRSARLLTGDHHLAEDLVQAVLLKLYLRWGRSRRWDSPPAYARRVLFTTYLAWSGRRWSGERATGALPERPAAGPDPFADAETGPVQQALAGLPRGQRAVLVARFHEDLSVEQTAALLGITTGTVKSQTAKALDRMRQALVTEPVEER
jgi:RNA polymerase sigma-70 factor (sigma-E family)